MNDRRVYVRNATNGFKGYIWRVEHAGETHIVNACDNYTAAESCGWSFGSSDVHEMQLVDVPQSNMEDVAVAINSMGCIKAFDTMDKLQEWLGQQPFPKEWRVLS